MTSFRFPSLLICSLSCLVLAPVGRAQGLLVRASIGGTVTSLPDGGLLSMAAEGLNRDVVASVVLQNATPAELTINSISVSQTSRFEISGAATPYPLAPYSTSTFNLRFSASTLESASAIVLITYTQGTASSVLSFSAVGSVFDLSFQYFILPSGSLQGLSNNSRIYFDRLNVGSRASAVLIVANRGTAPGPLRSMTLSGDPDFQLGGEASYLPASIKPGEELRVNLIFRPTKTGTIAGGLNIRVSDVNQLFVTLEGVGTTPEYRISYAVSPSNNEVTLTNGGSMVFPSISSSGSSVASVSLLNRGTGAGAVNSITLTGDGFELRGLAPFPIPVEANQTIRFSVAFTPRKAGSYTGILRVEFDSGLFTVSLGGSTSQPTFQFAYANQTGNTVALLEGSVIAATDVRVGGRLDITILMENKGDGAGILNNISFNGPKELQLAQLPVFPFTLEAARELRFTLRFSPLARGTFAGAMQVVTAAQTYTFRVEVIATGPSYSYELVTADSVVEVKPNDTIEFPRTDVGKTEKVNLRVRNTGDADGSLTSVLLSGPPFDFADSPFSPIVVKPGGAQQFTISFAPKLPGDVSGRLRVGDDTFTLKGVGVGPALTYSYSRQGSTEVLLAGGIIVLPTLPVGENATVQMTVKNTGNKAAPVFGISLSESSLVFQLKDLPQLPFELQADSTLTFTIRFEPNDVGPIGVSLRVNLVGFSVSGTGAAPTQLPQYSFGGASGVQEPLQQPAIEINLNQAYPIALQGTLTLDFFSDVFANNPAVQFATGGRIVRFRIPAGSTKATFDNSSSSVRVQTGTVAGTIVLTPAFATEANLDVTPRNPATQTLAIQRGAPKVVEARIVSRTLTGLVVVITGYTTTRSLTQAEVTLTPRNGIVLNGTKLTVPLLSSSLVWFQSAASEPFGGLFSFAIPIFLQGDGKKDQDLTGQIESLAITVNNEVGASNSVSAPII